MAVQSAAYLIFVFPIIISIAFGAFVLTDVLGQPDRHLNMWPFGNAMQPIQIGDKDIQIQNLLRYYSSNAPVSVKVLVNNTAYSCGDLYITIYDTGLFPKQAVSQNGFFSQCFVNNTPLPINDTFTQKISKTGTYQIVAEISDKNNLNTISTSANFTIR